MAYRFCSQCNARVPLNAVRCPECTRQTTYMPDKDDIVAAAAAIRETWSPAVTQARRWDKPGWNIPTMEKVRW